MTHTLLTRRSLMLGTAALLATPAILSMTRRASAATTLTLGHGAAPGNPRTVAADKFAELVAQKTEGRITINVAGSETLGSDAANCGGCGVACAYDHGAGSCTAGSCALAASHSQSGVFVQSTDAHGSRCSSPKRTTPNQSSST